MDKTYWNQRWEDGRTEFNQAEPHNFLVQGFKHLKLPAGARIFVPLCGKSVDMTWLLQENYELVGIELNLGACREFFKENNIPYEEQRTANFIKLKGEKITLFAGDFFKLTAEDLGQVDAIYDRAAYVALPEKMRQQYAEHISTITHASQYFLITMSFDQSQMAGPPFSVDEHEIREVFGKSFQVEEVLSKILTDELPPHFRARGLKSGRASLFILTR